MRDRDRDRVPHAAIADGAGVIAASGDDRAAVAEAMARAIAGRAARVVADAVGEARAAVAAGAVPIETLERFRRVREQIDEGWRAYLRVAVESAQLAARRRADRGRAAASRSPAAPSSTPTRRCGSARCSATSGARTEAQAVLALALALDPDRPITLAEFSPDVVDAVDAARAAPVADPAASASRPSRRAR